jgi:hypothetical protein
MADCRRPQLTWVDHPGLWLLPVLNLPGMVKGVPGSPAGHEQGRAARAGQVGAVSRGGAGFNLGQDSGAQARDGGNVAGQKGPLLDPGHPGMENLGLADVVDDRVAIPATTARALAKHPRRGSRGLLEHLPRGSRQSRESPKLRRRDRLAVKGGRDVESAEIRPGRASHALSDLEPGTGRRAVKRDIRLIADRSVAWPHGGQRGQRWLFAAASSAPAGPSDRVGEDLPGADLQVYLGHLAIPAALLRAAAPFGQHVRARELGSSRRSDGVIHWPPRSRRGGRRGGPPCPDLTSARRLPQGYRTNCRHRGARGSP